MSSSEKVEEVSGNLRLVDEADSREEAREAVDGSLEMRALLKPQPAVLYLMQDERYLEIEVSKIVKVVSVEEDEEKNLCAEELSADLRLLRIDVEEENDLFKGQESKSVWLAAEDEAKRNTWKKELDAAIDRFKSGWTPNLEQKSDNPTDHIGHDHSNDQNGHAHGHAHGKDTSIRFKIGTKVLCNTGMWSPGKVVALNYREEDWPEEETVPYQVELETGGLIFAPIDDDNVIRLDDGSPPPPITVEKEVDEASKTPVTVITGFLGAGKTTLVNYILTSKEHGMRIAIVENEFGAINIDQALVEDNVKTNEDLITMQNGCICCTVRGDLINAMQQLAERRDKIDAVIIETTGLADPGPVCVSFKMPQLSRHFRVDGIVCLVDSKYIESHLLEKRNKGAVNESAQQLGFADKILLNKVDLVSRRDIVRIKKTIRNVNGFAELIETTQSCVPLDRILGISAFDVDRMVDLSSEIIEDETQPEDCETDKKCCTPTGCEKQQATEELKKAQGVGNNKAARTNKKKKRRNMKHDLTGVGSIGLSYEGVISEMKFCQWLNGLLAKEGFALNLYRCKGVLCLDVDPSKKFVFQGVHDNIQCKASTVLWGPNEKKTNKVVFIGRGLDKTMIEKGFKNIQA